MQALTEWLEMKGENSTMNRQTCSWSQQNSGVWTQPPAHWPSVWSHTVGVVWVRVDTAPIPLSRKSQAETRQLTEPPAHAPYRWPAHVWYARQACWVYADNSVWHAQASLDTWLHQEVWRAGERDSACNSPVWLSKFVVHCDYIRLLRAPVLKHVFTT